MKNIVSTLGWFLICSVLTLPSVSRSSSAPLRIVTTIPDLASIARAVGGDFVTVESIVKGGQDPHFVDPKPSLIIRLSRADALIHVGLEMESGWLPAILRSARNSRILPGTAGDIDASSGIRVLEKPDGKVSRTEGDVHPHGNPHYWLDPANGAQIARTIEKALIALDASHAAAFTRNREAFEEKLNAKLAAWRARMAPWKGTVVVTYHRSWVYFADAFGLVMPEEAEIEPRPGIPPSPGHTREVIRLIGDRHVPIVLQDPYYDDDAGTEISRRTGAAFLILPSMVGGASGVNDTFDLFDRLTASISKAMESRNGGKS